MENRQKIANLVNPKVCDLSLELMSSCQEVVVEAKEIPPDPAFAQASSWLRLWAFV